MENKYMDEETLEAVTGGNSDEAFEFREWATRHIPELQGADPYRLNDGYAAHFLAKHIPEFGGYAEPLDGGNRTYYVKQGGETKVMSQEEFMSLLIQKYGD